MGGDVAHDRQEIPRFGNHLDHLVAVEQRAQALPRAGMVVAEYHSDRGFGVLENERGLRMDRHTLTLTRGSTVAHRTTTLIVGGEIPMSASAVDELMVERVPDEI